jgi:hypothetical protein
MDGVSYSSQFTYNLEIVFKKFHLLLNFARLFLEYLI